MSPAVRKTIDSSAYARTVISPNLCLIAPKLAIPIHYRTFPVLAQSADGFAPEGVEVRTMEPGEVLRYG